MSSVALAVLAAVVIFALPVLSGQRGIVVGFVPDNPTDVDAGQMLEVLDVWDEYLGQAGVGQFDAIVANNIDELSELVRAGGREGQPLVFGVVPSWLSYARPDLHFAPLLVCRAHGTNTIMFLVVTLRSNRATKVEELRGQRLALVRGLKGLERPIGVFALDGKDDPRHFFSELVFTNSLKDALLAVLRRQADAALVHSAYFDIAKRRSRTVWREFKILHRSFPVRMATVVSLPDTPNTMMDAARDSLLQAPDTNAGKHIMEVFDMDGIERCSWADLAGEKRLFLQKAGSLPSEKPSGTARLTPSLTHPGPVPTDSRPTPLTTMPTASKAVAVESFEVERDTETGEVSALIRFASEPPWGIQARVLLDRGKPTIEPLQCMQSLCMLILAKSRVAMARSLTLQLLIDRGGNLTPTGKPRTFILKPEND